MLDPGESIADASTYADEHKREIPGSTPWHYVNVPIDEDRYKDEFCGEKGCVIEKIKGFVNVLKDKHKSRGERQLALRFLIHLVGDRLTGFRWVGAAARVGFVARVSLRCARE